MATHDATPSPSIDRWTLVGLSLLLLPLLTMAHELGGHALTCVALITGRPPNFSFDQ